MAPPGLSSSQTPTVNMSPLHQAILLPLSGVFQMESPGGYPPSAYYQTPMDRAGHKQKLANKVETDPMETKCSQRSRNVNWFNLPWISNIRTNVGAKFISLLRLLEHSCEWPFNQSDLRNRATLSKFVWKERDKWEEPECKLPSAKPYSLGGKSCPLCLAEKTAIATNTSAQMLNRRRELMNRCLHNDPFKLLHKPDDGADDGDPHV